MISEDDIVKIRENTKGEYKYLMEYRTMRVLPPHPPPKHLSIQILFTDTLHTCPVMYSGPSLSIGNAGICQGPRLSHLYFIVKYSLKLY